MTEKLKKDWQKPELIVLVRSKPEEAVLGTCKGTIATTAPGPNGRLCASAPNNCMNLNPS